MKRPRSGSWTFVLLSLTMTVLRPQDCRAQMSFSGYVQNENGTRQADAVVSLWCGGLQARTNANGEFTIQGAIATERLSRQLMAKKRSLRFFSTGTSLVVDNPLSTRVSLSLLDCAGRVVHRKTGLHRQYVLSLAGQSGMRIAVVENPACREIVPLMCVNGIAVNRGIPTGTSAMEPVASSNGALRKTAALETADVLFRYSPIRHLKAQKSGFVPAFATVTSDRASNIAITINSTNSFSSLPDCQNPSLPLEIRVNDAVSRLTTAEKQAFLGTESAISKLGYTPIYLYNQCHHGMCTGGSNSVVFPSNINLGATWNPALNRAIGSATGDEGRAMSDNRGALNCFSPQVNMGFLPYWGRVIETFGEDPCLTGKLGSEYIRGLQGHSCEEEPFYLKAIANVKHFAVYGAGLVQHEEEGMPADNLNERLIRDYYLPHFKQCFIEGGSAGTMCSYTRINGTFACENNWLLKDVLRNEWGFTGFVIADLDADQRFTAGCDVPLAPGSGFWTGATNADIDTGTARLLRSFIRGGVIFSHADANPYHTVPNVSGCAQHRDLARQAARESIVLLKNENNLLPLSKNIGRIAVIGAHANAPRISFADCNSSGSSYEVLPLKGIQDAVSANTQVSFVPVYSTPEGTADLAQAETAARSADVAIVVVGIAGDAHPSGWKTYEGEMTNRSTLALPGQQGELIQRVKGTGKPTVVVVQATQVTLEWAAASADAILWYGYPGIAGGSALADILFGDYNPSGRLPITYYRKEIDLFSKASYDVEQGYTYRYFQGSPLYPFGHGLSYSTFTYANLSVTPSSPSAGDAVQVSVDVTNSGSRTGDEVVQLYVKDVAASAPVPIRKLQDFTRITLSPGQTKKVTFQLTPEQLSILTNPPVRRIVEPGDFLISVGGGQPVSGMTNYVTRTITLSGSNRELPL